MRSPRRVLFSFVVVFVVAFVVLGLLAWQIHVNRANAARGQEAHDALCIFKGDLGRRMDETKAFLDDPPKRIFGIPVTDEMLVQIKTQLASQKATYDSLSGLDCS